MSADPFDTLGLPPAFDLPRASLEKQHRDLSRALHPDRYSGSPPGERRQALSRAIDVNEAYRVLRDPVSRAEALLSRLGVPSAERDAGATPAFLMAVMDWREALAAAGCAKDLGALEALTAEVSAKERAALQQLSSAFGHLLQSGADEAALLSAKQQLGALRYYRRFLEEAANLMDEMD